MENTISINGRIIVFTSKTKKAKQRVSRLDYVACAFRHLPKETLIVVKCDYDELTLPLFKRAIIADVYSSTGVKLKYKDHSYTGIDIDLPSKN